MNNSNKRLFYILVPVYNVEKYLVECIESVLNQIYMNWQLILVDDGSTDLSGDICDKYAAMDSRITAIHKKNGGSISARQAGRYYLLDHNYSDNAFVLYLDSDDLYEEDTLKIVNELIDSTGSDLIIYNYRRFEDGEKLPKIENQEPLFEIIEDKAALYKKVFVNAGFNSLCRKAANINLLERKDYKDYFSVVYGEDLLESIPLLKKAKRVLFTEANLYRYRMNPTSLTHSLDYKSFQVVSTVRQEVWKFLKQENVWTKKDYIDYIENCKRYLKNDVRMIAGFKTHKKNMYELFDDILADDYYKIVLKYTKKKDCILNNLKKKNYNTVLCICALYRVAAALKRIFRK